MNEAPSDELIVEIEYYPSGEVEYKSSHEPWSGENLLAGPCVHYYKNGNKISKGDYMPGAGCPPDPDIYTVCDPPTKHGLWTYWYSNGQKKMQCNYHYGVKSGPCIKWCKNGDKESEALYIDGLIIREDDHI